MNRDEAALWSGELGEQWQARRFKQVARIARGQVDPTRAVARESAVHADAGTGREAVAQ